MYSIDRITSPEPNWEYAIIYAKGVQPLAISPDGLKIRLIRSENLLVIEEANVLSPFEQSTLQEEYRIDKELHFFVEEIVRVEFYTNGRKIKIGAPGPAQGGILTAEGENQAIAKEREELSKKNPLRKAGD